MMAMRTHVVESLLLLLLFFWESLTVMLLVIAASRSANKDVDGAMARYTYLWVQSNMKEAREKLVVVANSSIIFNYLTIKPRELSKRKFPPMVFIKTISP